MALSCVASSLLYKVLEEVDCCDRSFRHEASDKWHFDLNVLARANLIREVTEHLLAASSALIFAQATEAAHLTVVDLNFWDDTTGAIQCHWADLSASVMRDTSLEHRP